MSRPDFDEGWDDDRPTMADEADPELCDGSGTIWWNTGGRGDPQDDDSRDCPGCPKCEDDDDA